MEQQRRRCDGEKCKVRYKVNFFKFLLDKGEDAYEVLVNSENHYHEGCFKKNLVLGFLLITSKIFLFNYFFYFLQKLN